LFNSRKFQRFSKLIALQSLQNTSHKRRPFQEDYTTLFCSLYSYTYTAAIKKSPTILLLFELHRKTTIHLSQL
jgi:hypothetical protein